jgi:protein-disulfide isomerase
MKRALVALLLLCATLAVADTSFLKPPAGSNLAIAVFEDMQCPSCATAYPLIQAAGKRYNVPVLLYDFPLPQHPWSMDAAVLARYFDTQSKQMGEDFRAYIYKNQAQITKGNLRSYADRFAGEHGTAMPFALDPQGQLAAKVQADKALGSRIPLQHTPTVYVVLTRPDGTSDAREVSEITQLDQVLQQARQEVPPPAATKSVAKKAPVKKTAAKKQ